MSEEIDLGSLSDDELIQQVHQDLYDGLLEEVEEAVKSHASVLDAVCVGIPDDRFGELKTKLAEGWAEVRGFKVRRLDRALHGAIRQPAARAQPLAEPDDARKGIDDPELARSRRLGDQQPAIVGAKVERGVEAILLGMEIPVMRLAVDRPFTRRRRTRRLDGRNPDFMRRLGILWQGPRLKTPMTLVMAGAPAFLLVGLLDHARTTRSPPALARLVCTRGLRRCRMFRNGPRRRRFRCHGGRRTRALLAPPLAPPGPTRPLLLSRIRRTPFIRPLAGIEVAHFLSIRAARRPSGRSRRLLVLTLPGL